ncbi:MAG: MarR family transcriptional regulator [Clostridia bacterium]|nr:MarR family transcriptional regulator [Clostridia bacterium]
MENITAYFRSITQAEYHKVYKRLEKYNLVNGQASLLSIIKENDGLSQNELANILNVKPSSMSERINKLEALGYINRIVDEDNLRMKRIFITTEGKKAAVQCKRILNEFEETLFAGFTKKDKRMLENYLQKMLQNLE